MPKALVIIKGIAPAISAAKMQVVYEVGIDTVPAFRSDGLFPVDFTLGAAMNILNFKTNVIARVNSQGGPTLLATDIIIWGGVA